MIRYPLNPAEFAADTITREGLHLCHHTPPNMRTMCQCDPGTCLSMPEALTRTLSDCADTAEEIQLAAHLATQALRQAHRFDDQHARRQALRQLREIAKVLPGLIAEVEGWR